MFFPCGFAALHYAAHSCTGRACINFLGKHMYLRPVNLLQDCRVRNPESAVFRESFVSRHFLSAVSACNGLLMTAGFSVHIFPREWSSTYRHNITFNTHKKHRFLAAPKGTKILWIFGSAGNFVSVRLCFRASMYFCC